jgi:phage tail sheath gpL-like
MVNTFKAANPNTELWAMPLSGGTAKASGTIKFSVALSHNNGSASTGGERVNLFVNGVDCGFTLTSAWSVADVNSAAAYEVNRRSTLPVTASTNAASALNLIAICSGTLGNYIDFRFNYYTGESSPTCFKNSITIATMAGGTADPAVSDAWSVIANEQFQYIVTPYADSTNLGLMEVELARRFGPLVDQQGQAFTAVRATHASAVTLGTSRNSPHVCNIAANLSPTAPEEWAASFGAVAAANLNNDPARPLHYLTLPGVLPPLSTDRFTRAERDILLYDGIATWITDSASNVLIERSITGYRANAAGIPDASYLDVETLATLAEIRYQFKSRMVSRFIAPRFKLVDDNTPIQGGSNVVSPKTIKAEIIALFGELQDAGLIEDLASFIKNVIVERDESDRNRVNVMLPPDVVNQFRVLAGLTNFIL